MTEGQFSTLLDEKIETLFTRLQISLRSDLDRAIDNLKEVKGTKDIEGIRYLKTAEVCSLLKISDRTLYRKRKANEIGFVIKKGIYYYKAKDVSNLMNEDYVESLRSSLNRIKKEPG